MLVTGGGGGIGLDAAKAMAEAGADVAITYNSSKKAVERAQDIADTYKVKAKAYQMNVVSLEAVEETVAQVVKDFGKIDNCIVNHGIPSTTSVLDGGLKEWNKVVNVNYNGAFYVANTVGKLFRDQKSGNMIFTGSMSGHIANYPQLQGCYNSTKAALIHLAKSLALEWAPFNVRVNSISPGYIHTEISNFIDKKVQQQWYDLTPMQRDGDPRELKGAYLYLASNASTYTTGTDIIVVSLLICQCPSLLFNTTLGWWILRAIERRLLFILAHFFKVYFSFGIPFIFSHSPLVFLFGCFPQVSTEALTRCLYCRFQE